MCMVGAFVYTLLRFSFLALFLHVISRDTVRPAVAVGKVGKAHGLPPTPWLRRPASSCLVLDSPRPSDRSMSELELRLVLLQSRRLSFAVLRRLYGIVKRGCVVRSFVMCRGRQDVHGRWAFLFVILIEQILCRGPLQ